MESLCGHRRSSPHNVTQMHSIQYTSTGHKVERLRFAVSRTTNNRCRVRRRRRRLLFREMKLFLAVLFSPLVVSRRPPPRCSPVCRPHPILPPAMSSADTIAMKGQSTSIGCDKNRTRCTHHRRTRALNVRLQTSTRCRLRNAYFALRSNSCVGQAGCALH